ncbi:MAG: DUF4229 domain-containing protein [Cryobacterium sp.]
MKTVPAWLTYSALRVLMFALPLAVLLLLGLKVWLSAVLAALIGVCLSYLFLRSSRNALSSDLYAARHRATPATHVDADTEDAAIRAEDAAQAGRGSEGEGEPQQNTVGEPGETGEFQGKN